METSDAPLRGSSVTGIYTDEYEMLVSQKQMPEVERPKAQLNRRERRRIQSAALKTLRPKHTRGYHP